MKIDVVRHLRARVILKVKLHDIALADADERAGHAAAVGPEGVFDAVGQPRDKLAHLEMHDDAGRVFARNRRRDLGRHGEHGILDWQRKHRGRENHRAFRGLRAFGGVKRRPRQRKREQKG